METMFCQGLRFSNDLRHFLNIETRSRTSNFLKLSKMFAESEMFAVLFEGLPVLIFKRACMVNSEIKFNITHFNITIKYLLLKHNKS